jgi:hypothetical protein
MGRAGIEPATLGLKVRIYEPSQAVANGNLLHFSGIETAPNCTDLHGLETSLYARSYARASSD